MHRLVFTVLILCGLVNLAYSADPYPVRPYPIAKGSFVQEWFYKDWNDKKWAAEMAILKEAEMEYIVLQSTVDTRSNMAVYPTRIRGFKKYPGNKDSLEMCLKNAQKQGIKVFIGLNGNEDFWNKYAKNTGWIFNEMEIGNQIAGEIYQNYYPRYKETIAGWYWWWELDNENYKTPQDRENITKALDISTRYLHQLSPGLPVMQCPFMNPACSTPQEYRDFWIYVFRNSSFGKGDIFCPQDCIGTENLNLETVEPWFVELKKAVETKPGLQFWVDTETFLNDDAGCTIGRFVSQLQKLSSIVDKYLTFAYIHYQSPYQSNPGYHKTYLEYVKTGKLENIPPTPVEKIQVSFKWNKQAVIRWNPATDNIGVCGYIIYRNGEKIATLTLPQKMSYTDTKSKPFKTLEYKVVPYDFAGNQPVVTNSITVTRK